MFIYIAPIHNKNHLNGFCCECCKVKKQHNYGGFITTVALRIQCNATRNQMKCEEAAQKRTNNRTHEH